jgi:hypothetical protein
LCARKKFNREAGDLSKSNAETVHAASSTTTQPAHQHTHTGARLEHTQKHGDRTEAQQQNNNNNQNQNTNRQTSSARCKQSSPSTESINDPLPKQQHPLDPSGRRASLIAGEQEDGPQHRHHRRHHQRTAYAPDRHFQRRSGSIWTGVCA